jgi:hypothetical protein
MKVVHCSVADLCAQPLTEAGPVMVLPCTDPRAGRQAAELAARRAGVAGLLLVVHDTERTGFVAVVNTAFRCTRSPWLGYMAQDAFAGRGWLALGLQAMQARGAGLLAFNDGKWNGQLAAFGLARRTWVDGLYGGDFFHPGYRRHFADAELTLLARQAGLLAYEPESVLVEVDWAKDQAAVDAEDRRLFHARQAGGFGGRVTDPDLLSLIR